jgi:phosphoheptose isomerase
MQQKINSIIQASINVKQQILTDATLQQTIANCVTLIVDALTKATKYCFVEMVEVLQMHNI